MNQLNVAKQNAIIALAAKGWSYRRIARELGIHRETVARYVRLGAQAGEESKPAKVTPGSGERKPAKVTAGSPGPQSFCETHRERITAMLKQGLSAQRIWQDLVGEDDFTGSYQSVKRFVRHLRSETPLPFRRLECSAGEEAQVDFGKGAFITQADGKRRRPHLFRIVLSYSRKAYSEVVYRQTTEAFIRSIENAFWSWGGVPKVLVIDNLRAAVKHADWFDPELNPKVESFCRHYGVVILPTRPYTPRHKGKIESGVDYAQENALKGRSFPDLANQNQYLWHWETHVADTRIHGTTRRQVRAVFEAEEHAALQPLPRERFPFFHEGQRRVHRDGHVEVDRAYYSVPPEYVGHRVWVRWDSRILRIYNRRMESIALHCKREAGRFATDPKHIASEKRSAVERGAQDLLAKARRIGPQTGQWAEAMIAARGIQGIRVLVGLLSLSRKSQAASLETACGIARMHGAYRLRAIRELVKRHEKKQVTAEYLSEHPIIRSLGIYQELVDAATAGDGP